MAKICVPVCVRRLDDLGEAIKTAAGAGDIVEIRADCLEIARPNFAHLQPRIPATDVPIIFTLRSPDQGGQSNHDYETRRRFWSSLGRPPANVFVDLELDLVDDYAESAAGQVPVD